MLNNNVRPVEVDVIRNIDQNARLLQFIKAKGREEAAIERSEKLRGLVLENKAFRWSMRKALAFCSSRTELRSIMLDMESHDRAFEARAKAVKPGFVHILTSIDMERAIESTQIRIGMIAASADPVIVGRKQIYDKGSVRMKNGSKIKYALSVAQLKELVLAGFEIEQS